MHRTSKSRSAIGTPLLRISRPVAACSRCRRAKTKCDGKLPACTACEKTGHAHSCVSVNDKSVERTEKSYVVCLESRIEELKETLAFAIAKKSSVTLQESNEPFKESGYSDSSTALCAAIDGKVARRRETADVNKIVSDFGFLSINATTQDFEKTNTSMTFARLILAATIHEPLAEYQPFRLPAKVVARALINYYIENILSLIPIFPEMVLLNVFNSVYQQDPQPLTDSEYWLFYMVLAISSTSQSRSNTDQFYKNGVAWVGRALIFADRVLVPGYVSQIQALVLLVQYSMLDPAHFDSWILIGFACRALVDLGFHQDPPKEEQTDQNTLELRRTIFYCVYSLDRSISIVHARSFSFTDDSTNVALPSKIFTENTQINCLQRDPMEDALLLFKFRMIQSSWYQELFQSSQSALANSSTFIWQICQKMQKWAETIPECVSAHRKQLFDLELYYSYVYCLAPSSRVKAVSAHGKSLIFHYSIKYIQKLAEIFHTPTNYSFYTYHEALRVFFVGSQLVSVLTDDQDHIFNTNTLLASPLGEYFKSLPLPHVDRIENIRRSLNCIDQTRDLLGTFGHRWEDSKILLASFEAKACLLVESLSQKGKSINFSSGN
ncbi:Positive regulator of purine utilization [Golovinomyces cichoracearum]|uniref:Positive regulator of purine utilization n=1 Tax=Golovinomyces cichoracearum TaxID=62708 RepID=A0A420H7P6_9PEZI|nr:Positive regulator of purine utilization [Golovinomyces cichoracearum]